MSQDRRRPVEGQPRSTLAKDGEGDDKKLQNVWTFYYDEKSAKGLQRDSYASTLKKLGEFGTVKEFWRYVNNIEVGNLTPNSNLRLFRSGIEPTWEDPSNQNGGKFVLELPSGISVKELWTTTALILVGELFSLRSTFCGAVLSVRARGITTINIWNNFAFAIEDIHKGEEDIQRLIVSKLVENKKQPISVQLHYQPHKQSVDWNHLWSSSKNKSQIATLATSSENTPIKKTLSASPSSPSLPPALSTGISPSPSIISKPRTEPPALTYSTSFSNVGRVSTSSLHHSLPNATAISTPNLETSLANRASQRKSAGLSSSVKSLQNDSSESATTPSKLPESTIKLAQTGSSSSIPSHTSNDSPRSDTSSSTDSPPTPPLSRSGELTATGISPPKSLAFSNDEAEETLPTMPSKTIASPSHGSATSPVTPPDQRSAASQPRNISSHDNDWASLSSLAEGDSEPESPTTSPPSSKALSEAKSRDTTAQTTSTDEDAQLAHWWLNKKNRRRGRPFSSSSSDPMTSVLALLENKNTLGPNLLSSQHGDGQLKVPDSHLDPNSLSPVSVIASGSIGVRKRKRPSRGGSRDKTRSKEQVPPSPGSAPSSPSPPQSSLTSSAVLPGPYSSSLHPIPLVSSLSSASLNDLVEESDMIVHDYVPQIALDSSDPPLANVEETSETSSLTAADTIERTSNGSSAVDSTLLASQQPVHYRKRSRGRGGGNRSSSVPEKQVIGEPQATQVSPSNSHVPAEATYDWKKTLMVIIIVSLLLALSYMVGRMHGEAAAMSQIKLQFAALAATSSSSSSAQTPPHPL